MIKSRMTQTLGLLQPNYRFVAVLMYSLVVIRASSLHHRTSEVYPSHWLWKLEPQGPNPSGVNGWDDGHLTETLPGRHTSRWPPAPHVLCSIIAGLLRGRHRNRAEAIPTLTWFTHDRVVINERFWRIHMEALRAPAPLHHRGSFPHCIAVPPA